MYAIISFLYSSIGSDRDNLPPTCCDSVMDSTLGNHSSFLVLPYPIAAASTKIFNESSFVNNNVVGLFATVRNATAFPRFAMPTDTQTHYSDSDIVHHMSAKLNNTNNQNGYNNEY